MARPSKFDRDVAVEIAMKEIWRHGYESTSVKALSEKLGITRSSFYNAFGNREALFIEALQLYAGRSPDILLADETPGSSVKKIITETFRTICKVRAYDPEIRGCLAVKSIAELSNTHCELGEIMKQAVTGNAARIENLLKRGVRQKEISPGVDIRALALALQNLLFGINVLSQVVDEEKELWKTAELTLKGLDLFESNVQQGHPL